MNGSDPPGHEEAHETTYLPEMVSFTLKEPLEQSSQISEVLQDLHPDPQGLQRPSL
jgi:hypothetical protein